MELNRLTQLFRPPDGVQPLDPKIQHYHDSGKRPFEEVKKLIKKEHKKIAQIKKDNKISEDFWGDGFTPEDEAKYLEIEELDTRSLKKWKKFYGIRNSGRSILPGWRDNSTGHLGL